MKVDNGEMRAGLVPEAILWINEIIYLSSLRVLDFNNTLNHRRWKWNYEKKVEQIVNLAACYIFYLYTCVVEKGGYDFEVFWSSFYATVAYICYLPIRTWEQAFLVFVVSWFWPKFHLHSFSFNAFSWHWSFKVNQWQGGNGTEGGSELIITFSLRLSVESNGTEPLSLHLIYIYILAMYEG